jgi:O-antigen/teichoic acid export membrane protein
MKDGQLTSEEEVGKSMLKVVRGGILIFVAIALSQLLGFLRQLSIIRLLSPEEYGLISLGMIVTEIFIIIATLGLNLGSQRYIAFSMGKGDERRTRGVIFSTNGILIISVTMITIAAPLLASPLSRFFDMEEMSGVIMWLALLIAPYVTIDILASYFLGFHRAGPKAVFQRIFLGIASLVCTIAFLMVRKDLASALLAMAVSYIIVAVIVLFYSTRNFPIKLRGGERIPMARTMLVFSIPLFATAALGYLIFQIDTLILGYYVSAEMVGIYNGAFIFSQFLAAPLNAVALIYMPIISSMAARDRHEELKAVYRSATKWLFIATLPLFLVLFMFPRNVLSLFLGADYIEAAVALQLLCAGEFVNTLVGPLGMTLLAYGRTNLMMINSIIAVTASIILNVILIPRFGIEGAAFGLMISLTMANALSLGFLYFIYHIHPFYSNYVKPVLIISAISGVLYLPMKSLLAVSDWFVIGYYPFLLGLGIAVLVLSHNLEPWDRFLIRAVWGKLKGGEG